MSHTYAQNYLHVVFSTKERRKWIGESMQPKLWAYMAGIGRNHGVLVLANGGMKDHVHPTGPIAARAGAGAGCLSAQIKFRTMDERAWNELCMAGGIRSLQREHVKPGKSGAVHREAAATTPKNDL